MLLLIHQYSNTKKYTQINVFIEFGLLIILEILSYLFCFALYRFVGSMCFFAISTVLTRLMILLLGG